MSRKRLTFIVIVAAIAAAAAIGFSVRRGWKAKPTPQIVNASSGQGTTATYQVEEKPAAPEPSKPCPTVEELPTVEEFLASPTTLRRGASATLWWEAKVTKSATITDLSTGVVTSVSPQSGKLVVAPASSRTYRLSVSSSCGTLTKDITITVKN